MRPMMKLVIVLVIVGCTLGASSLRIDHDVVVAQQRTRIVATRIFTGPDGQTHVEEIELKLAPGEGSTELSEMVKATGAQFRRQAPSDFEDWHTAPRRQYVVTLSGQGEIEIGGGRIAAHCLFRFLSSNDGRDFLSGTDCADSTGISQLQRLLAGGS